MPKAKEILFAVILLLYSFAYPLPFLVSNLTRFDWESETMKLVQENNIERVFLVTSVQTTLAALIFILGIIPIIQVLKQIILNFKGNSSLSDF
jgi:hypothetical protein